MKIVEIFDSTSDNPKVYKEVVSTLEDIIGHGATFIDLRFLNNSYYYTA